MSFVDFSLEKWWSFSLSVMFQFFSDFSSMNWMWNLPRRRFFAEPWVFSNDWCFATVRYVTRASALSICYSITAKITSFETPCTMTSWLIEWELQKMKSTSWLCKEPSFVQSAHFFGRTMFVSMNFCMMFCVCVVATTKNYSWVCIEDIFFARFFVFFFLWLIRYV